MLFAVVRDLLLGMITPASMAVVRFLAAGEGGSVDPTSLAQYGIAGVVGFFLIQFMRAALDKERERADRLEAALLEANKTSNRDALGALASATAAISEATTVAQEWKKERDSALAKLRKRA